MWLKSAKKKKTLVNLDQIVTIGVAKTVDGSHKWHLLAVSAAHDTSFSITPNMEEKEAIAVCGKIYDWLSANNSGTIDLADLLKATGVSDEELATQQE